MNNSFIGQTINNRYRLDSLLGDGGMGAVYRAFDLNLERQVAIKLMHGHFARQAEFRQRLVQEAQTAAKLDHPSIVRIYDFGDSEQSLFIAMEYVDGGSLREHLQRLQRLNKYLPFAQSLQIGIQIAEALDYAHSRGVIHRDVKPGNIILKRLSHPDEPGEQPFRAVLTDFGLVKLQEGSPMTQSGATVGTPTYMSPEQCEGNKLDGRSDLYSLGVVLYELFTNRLPFAFQTLADAISTHRRGVRPAPAHEYRADAPQLIDSLLDRALAKSPDDRFQTGKEMADALRSALVSLEGAPTRVMMRQELDILDRVEDPPPGYELEIRARGHSTSVVALTQSVFTLGRNADNDIVLPSEDVSRRHARLQATSLGWEVTDLGGINGTWIDGRRIRVESPTPLVAGSTLRIGPYEMTLRGPEMPTDATTAAATAAAAALGATTPRLIDGPDDARLDTSTRIQPTVPLSMFVARERFDVDPGQQVEIPVEVVNNTAVDDRVTVRVLGVPDKWVVSRLQFTSLPGGERTTLKVVIRPPRHRSTPTGRQRLRLQLVSQRHPDANIALMIDLALGSFVAFAAAMDPSSLRLPGKTTISVRSTGNAPAYFTLVPRDPSQGLKFFGEKGRILLEPDHTANVELEIEARESTWFGAAEIYPFEVDVVSRTGGRQTLTGEGRSGGFLPPWLLYGLVFLLTFACAIAAIAAVVNRDRWFGQPTPTQPAVVDIPATQTAAAILATPTGEPTEPFETQTAVAATSDAATRAAATAAAVGDNDGDGLSNAQEELIGTDPNNPDTDGDLLSDGQEFLLYGTDPRNPDTDADRLSDGEEVLRYGTDPLNPDTNGDGILDGVNVALGRNPLATLTPTPTLTVSPSPTPPVGNVPGTQTAIAATQTSIAATQTAAAGANSATQTAVAGTLIAQTATVRAATAIAATQTAIAGATQTAVAGATQTAVVAATGTAEAIIGATQTAVVALTQTAAAGNSATQTAVAVTGTAQAQLTAVAAATQTAQAILTQTAAAPTETATPVPGTGTMLREYWLGLSGGEVSDLTESVEFPNAPTGSGQITSFEGPTNWNDNYGARFRGYIYPPTTGQYVFYIASDNTSELYLSSSESPAAKVLIASVPGFTNPQQWDKYASQRSTSITLQAGQRYYIEALHKESTGSDNFAVAWEIPSQPRQVIAGQYLAPYEPEPYP